MSTSPLAVQAGEGTVFETPTGDTAIVKLSTRQTNGTLAVIELVIGPRQGPAMHRHRDDDELWFVLEGDFRFKAGDEILHASTGGLAFGPHGVPHCFQNVGDQPGRLLVVTTPSGLEGFFEAWASGGVEPDLNEIGLAHGLEFVGPPVGVSDPLP